MAEGKTVAVEDAVVLHDPKFPPGHAAEDATGLTDAADPAASPQPARRGGFLPALLGGAVAAALGFGISQYLGNDSWPFSRGPSASDELAGLIDGQKAQLQALEARIVALSEAEPVPFDDPRIAELSLTLDQAQATLGGFSERADTLERRLSDLENRPIPDIGATTDAVAAYKQELAAMRAMFQAELVRIEAAQSDAVAVEQSAAERAGAANARAALARLEAAVESGAPLGAALDGMRRTGSEVPDALARHAETGVPTLAQLQRDFPGVARTALNASISAAVDSGETGKFAAFLRTQLGTRSLEPREGSDPDAILSRAEAALRSGEIARAINETEALPQAGQAAMTPWMNSANIRLEAIAAVTDLAQALNSQEQN